MRIISGCTEKEEHLRGLVWLPIKQIGGVPWNYSGVIWNEKIARCCDFLQSQFAAMRNKRKWLEFIITKTDRVCHVYRVNLRCMYVTELKDMFTLERPLICYGSSAGQSLVHTYIICPPIKSGNVCGLSLYLRKIVCKRTVSVVCRLGWKTADKICTSGRVRLHSYFLQCVLNLFAEVEQLRCGRTKAFLLLLRICSATHIYGMCICILQKPKYKKVLLLTFMKKNVKSMLLNLKKISIG